MRRDFTPWVVPLFGDTMEGQKWHLYWNGGFEWRKTLCGKRRADAPTPIAGVLCRRCATVATGIMDRWRAREDIALRKLRRERFRIARGVARER